MFGIRIAVVVALTAFLVAYSAVGAALAFNAWNLAHRATKLPNWYTTRPANWRVAGVGMLVTGLIVVGFLVLRGAYSLYP